MRGEVESGDSPCQRTPQRAIAHDDNLAGNVLIPQPSDRIEQHELALLRDQSSNGHEAGGIGDRRGGRPEEIVAQPAVDDMDLVPVVGVSPPPELRPAVITDRDREFSPADLLSQGQRLGESNSVGP